MRFYEVFRLRLKNQKTLVLQVVVHFSAFLPYFTGGLGTPKGGWNSKTLAFPGCWASLGKPPKGPTSENPGFLVVLATPPKGGFSETYFCRVLYPLGGAPAGQNRPRAPFYSHFGQKWPYFPRK